MYGKGKSNSSAVPSDSQAREKLALYVYEYLLHVGAQKSAQTFLSEIRWEKNITLGEPPGFLHSWWCVFWDLYCAAPERRETCEHSSEAKAFHDYPFMSPRYPGGPRPPLRIPNQALGGVPGSQPLLPSGMDPTRQQGHPNMGGPMQRMTPPRGMVPLGPQNYGGAMRPPLNALGGPGMPGMNMGPGGGRPWPNPTNANSIPYSSASPGNYVGPPGGGGPPGTPIMPSPADSTNSGDNMYTLMNAVPPGPNRPNFPMGPGSDGPMGGLGGMESHHMNGSLGSGDMDSISKNSPNNMSLSNQPGTPRDDGEMGGNFLNPFQSESICHWGLLPCLSISGGLRLSYRHQKAFLWGIKESDTTGPETLLCPGETQASPFKPNWTVHMQNCGSFCEHPRSWSRAPPIPDSWPSRALPEARKKVKGQTPAQS
ncbi:single-stranded DNA-binding protein 2 isoform X2 [Mirounga leonina]|uniref:single-stranded DNA-binding protein 2 isoform X2 n=1 Tax=Mirounga leonina TaxID=9715 RepID=UPI00156C44B5|nr:single-stranded DNA-binding protein 2 isoform X2 [Mirounga leonina]